MALACIISQGWNTATFEERVRLVAYGADNLHLPAGLLIYSYPHRARMKGYSNTLGVN
jgi:hypothetical protein